MKHLLPVSENCLVLEKWFPLWGERAHSFEIILYVR